MTQQYTSPSKADLEFYQHLCTARFVEAVISAILELSGYQVFSYGHEYLLPTLRKTFQEHTSRPEPTEERLRSNPDLLVLTPETNQQETRTRLVEVKYRAWESPKDVRLSSIAWYQQYWPEAILVVVIPGGACFYAQSVDQLNSRQRVFDLTEQFQPFETIFRQTKRKILEVFAAEIQRFSGIR